MEAGRVQLLDDVFQHLVLPPKVSMPDTPAEDDNGLNWELTARLRDACDYFQCIENGGIWKEMIASLALTQQVNQGPASKQAYLAAFTQFAAQEDVQWLALHVVQQNAALVIHKRKGSGEVVFESFEASAMAASVLETNLALKWDFPDRAVAISMEDFTNESFQDALAEFLEQATDIALDRFASRAYKAGKSVVESRDTPSPALISEMLMSYFEAIGETILVCAIKKRIRDDVVLDPKASKNVPWRRSPFWLILRVASQRMMCEMCCDLQDNGRAHYKFLMTVVLAQFLAACQGVLHPEKVLMLRAKLCRRLAKLENERSSASESLQPIYEEKFRVLKGLLDETLETTSHTITSKWDRYKKAIVRHVPLLPKRAAESDMKLKLQNSGQRLMEMLEAKVDATRGEIRLHSPSLGEGTVTQVNQLATQCSNIIDFAAKAKSTLNHPTPSIEAKCEGISQAILDYSNVVDKHFHDDALLMSQYLLNLFELWVAMDSLATTACPLLSKYHPIFIPEALDILSLATRAEMERLSRVQEYLARRVKTCDPRRGNIFSRPRETTAFAASFAQVKSRDGKIITLGLEITAASEDDHRSKTRELERLTKEYQDLTEAIGKYVCSCRRNADGSVNVAGCKRCWKARCRKRLRISVHEDFLPTNAAHKFAILFELAMPSYLAAYRKATWSLMMIGIHSKGRKEAAIQLSDFSPLKPFWSGQHMNGSVGLASSKKSFLQTHYGQQLRLPRTENDVLLPFGAEYSYFDATRGIWADELREPPWFQHLMGTWLPAEVPDPFASASLYLDKVEHPSSYEVAASQAECPSNMSFHEFCAYQRSVSGSTRRWLVLLVELGSANMNFSSDSTMNLFSRLSLQAGPSKHDDADILRAAHSVFSDAAFCLRLEDQIRQKLDSLMSGRRDVTCMSILTTLSLRLFNLCPTTIRPRAVELIRKLRHLMSDWINELRGEVRSAVDGETARKAANTAFRTSLLCRQTFTLYLDDQNQEEFGTTEALHFFRASIALSENLVLSLQELPERLRHLLKRDLCTAFSMRQSIKRWFRDHFSALQSAINETWNGGAEPRSFSKWQTLPDGQWVVSIAAATRTTAAQLVHFHMLQGHLLVDNKPLGRLPLQMREDANIQELFTGQHLLTRPSGLAGMQYQLVSNIQQHQLHFGYRKGSVVIRAMVNGHLFEHVPRKIFQGELMTDLDLPSGLIDDCVHWLNLDTGELEIRRKPRIWHQLRSNWILDVRRRTAVRNRKLTSQGFAGYGTSLVDPHSRTGSLIRQIFDGFEDLDKLTVFQPSAMKGRLSVELKRLEMRFFVNNSGLLQSDQLHSEIDPLQDIGTLHGLESKLVLRNVANSERRIVLVPIGSVSWQRHGIHVSTRICNAGEYALFTIDPLLGRLNCAPELLLLYLKALVHAVTSFPLPDELTGRTGTEEAHRCLTSAQSQPWTVLTNYPKNMLSNFLRLCPRRQYYPADKKIYQTVHWDNGLTAFVQHEQLASLALKILEQSKMLERFDTEFKNKKDTDSQGTISDHLTLRGIIRRQIYERIKSPSDSVLLSQGSMDVEYLPRDCDPGSDDSCRVYSAVKALRAPSGGLPDLAALGPILTEWENIDGFGRMFEVMDIEFSLTASLPSVWGSYVQRFRSRDVSKDHSAQFSLALLAFSGECDMRIVAWLVALSKHQLLQDVEPPLSEAFTEFRFFEALDADQVKKMIMSDQDSHRNFLYRSRGVHYFHKSRDPNAASYDYVILDEAGYLANKLKGRWPEAPKSLADLKELCKDLHFEYLDLGKAWRCLGPEMERLSLNRHLSEYIQSLEDVAQKYRDECDAQELEASRAIWASKPGNEIDFSTSAFDSFSASGYQVPSLSDVVSCASSRNKPVGKNEDVVALELSPPAKSDSAGGPDSPARHSSVPEEITMLRSIVRPFVCSESVTRRQYGEDLEQSIAALVREVQNPRPRIADSHQRNLKLEIGPARARLSSGLEGIRESLAGAEKSFRWLHAGHLWPCDSLTSLLERLRLENYECLSLGWKLSLVQLGLAVTGLQRLLRLGDATSRRDQRQIDEEQSNEGHSNWMPMDYPEWLLLEIDNDILIRPVQVDVAKAIIEPASGSNSVLQMNMGKGKTSCVMPMAVAILANKTRLCRIIVPKALLYQTAQVIQSRVGGLIGRQVRHVPFTRQSPADLETLNLYEEIHRDVQAAGGVMMCLPGHMLSFKLSGLQRLADGQLTAGRKMVKTQKWLNRSCRDILDESDLTLSVNTQLIYPSGDLTAVDGHPHRWYVVEELLALVEKHASLLQKRFERQIEVVRRHQGYPVIYFLSVEPEDALNEMLIDDVCGGHFSYLRPKGDTTEYPRDDVKRIVSGLDVPAATWEMVADAFADDVFGLRSLCLLRGLISDRVLLLCLKKKWNVQYGLDPERAPIAVPFEAKGVPSSAAEYGHPDTAIVLTCLAFYQAGLTKDQIRQSLDCVIKSDDPAAHYDRWTCGSSSLPSSLRHWNSIDTDSELQVNQLWKHLRFDRTVLNHYMNTFVFPCHAKQFSTKLQTSAWDIPLLSPDESPDESHDESPDECSDECSDETFGRKGLTTGFSGTNDNKRMLPQTIQQDDLPSLSSTNAEVLSYLLKPRNRECYLAAEKGIRLTETGTLEFLANKGIRILIDAGAHILEMENMAVAQAWLAIDHEAEGAVFFGQSSQLLVVSRFQKAVMPLIASSFANNLESCVIYIDEGHTRGTDLKLPANVKGAVTLGLGQTKDQTVQAAMRLRQLGTTQSVAFIAPPEVHRSMLDLRNAHLPERLRPAELSSIDVVRWLLEQSCRLNDHMMGLYISQCHDFCRRTNSLWKHPRYATDDLELKKVLRVIQQQEQQTLEQLYGPRNEHLSLESLVLDFPQLRQYVSNLTNRASKVNLSASHAFMEVEQEREIVFEVEQVRQVQKNEHQTASSFPGLDPVLVKFATTGDLDTSRADVMSSCIQAFKYVGQTRLGQKFGVMATTSRLFVSREFVNTIETSKYAMGSKEVLRPVDWILWSPFSQSAVIIIPEEAELLIPRLRESKTPRAWLLSYAAPVTKSMQVFNSMTYLTIPTWPKKLRLPNWLTIEAGFISGRLYFDYPEYKPLLSWLGVSEDMVFGGLGIEQPLRFLQEWVSERRQTEDILYTPMGFVCQRKLLHEGHFFFRSSQTDSGSAPITPHNSTRYTGVQNGEAEDSDDDDDGKWEMPGQGEIETGRVVSEE